MKKILAETQLSVLILVNTLLAGLLSGCTSGVPETAVPTPESTPTREVLPALDLDLADQYLVSGISAGESVALREQPAGAELVASLEIGTIGIQPTGGARKVENEVWIEVTSRGGTGWIQFKHLAVQVGELPPDLVSLAYQTTTAIRGRNYPALGSLIHPDLCLRFSPYPYLNPDNRILCQDDLAKIDSKQVYLWGKYDGTGLPINLTFQDYHDKFVYDLDYLQAPMVGLNVELSSGNSINNIAEIYPDGMMVEYYFPGIDPQYAGLDWRSLKLVFVSLDGNWYLTAIIHGEWTI